MPISPSERVAASIRDSIDAGRIRPGDRLDAFRELARLHQVNIATAARAVDQLRTAGYLESRRGMGTYVRSRPIPHRLPGFGPPADDQSATSTTTEPATERVATLLRIATGTVVHTMRWTESIDDQRIALATAYSIEAATTGQSDDAVITELVRSRLPSLEEMAGLGIADITPVLIVTRLSARESGLSAVVERVVAADRVELAYRER